MIFNKSMVNFGSGYFIVITTCLKSKSKSLAMHVCMCVWAEEAVRK